jgi:hypothetical protein
VQEDIARGRRNVIGKEKMEMPTHISTERSRRK